MDGQVPLEKQTVRFIDNFSAGTRGATSAEYFLDDKADYAVIFLHRQFRWACQCPCLALPLSVSWEEQKGHGREKACVLC